MASYHFNPSTGDVGSCRAKPGNCPFLAQGSIHFGSGDEARRYFEELQELNFHSRIAQLLVSRSRLQAEIIRRFAAKGTENEDMAALWDLTKERDVIEQALKGNDELLSSTPDSGWTAPQRLIHEPIAQDRGSSIVGIHNLQESLSEIAPATAQSMAKSSEQWLARLSPREAQAVRDYSGDPESANGNSGDLNAAVLKAPPLEPTVVYSGLSNFVASDVLSQYESGRISLGYPISSSLNPAQANGFMGKFLGTDPQPSIALELETSVGASMMAASHSPQEFELLLPAGSYEVESVRENVEILWADGGAGRTADLLIRARRKD